MLDFTWDVFLQTGNIETYILLKQLEEETEVAPQIESEQLTNSELPTM